ncbi:MAG: ABC transporter permease [Candidatus Izemoplasma sp.]
MIKRAWISVRKNKGRTIILGIILFVIANLVLSSISIKTATEEATLQARISLGPEITLTTNSTDLLTYIRAYRDEYGTRPSQEEINELLEPITSDIAFGIAESEYVTDFNFSFGTSSQAVDFLPLTSDGILDLANLNSISITGTYNPLLLDQFSDIGTYSLTAESGSFVGGESGVIIISDNLAYANNLEIGDTISLATDDYQTMEFEIIGLFQNIEILETSGKQVTDNNVFMSLEDSLLLKGQDPDGIFTITTAKYYLYDPLDIDAFVEESTAAYAEISEGGLTFSDVNFDAITDPLDSVAQFSDIILIASVIASVVILTLLIINTLKERKYEIGVLLSLGEAKIKISGQYLIELLLVALIAFSLSISTSNFVSGYLGDMLLDNEISDAESSTTTSSSRGGGGGGSFITTIPLGDVDYVDEIDVSITLNDFLITIGIGTVIIFLSSVIPSLYITRYQPKKILSSRN